MTQTGTRRLTERQLAKALAEIDDLLAGVTETQARFHAFAGNLPTGIAVPDSVGWAWNQLHNAETALREYRGRVELNPRPIPAAEQGTWELIQQNID